MGCGAQKATETNEKTEENRKQPIETEININASVIAEAQKVKVETEAPKIVENIKDDDDEDDDLEDLILLKDIIEYSPEELEERIKLDKQEEEDEDIPENISLDDGDEDGLERQKITVNYNSGPSDKDDGEMGGSSGQVITKKGKKKKINKKKPFVIMEIENDPYNKVKILINACSFCDEYMMPLWCPKDTFIKFKVDGKWRIDKLYEYTNSRGMPSTQTTGFNYGALVGRVGLGELFVVADQGTYLVKEEGPLFLRQNLPKKVKVHPEGKLELTIFDGIYMDIKEINDKIGWIEHGTIDNINENQNENIENNRNNNNNDSNDILVYKSINSNNSNTVVNKSINKGKNKSKKTNVKDLEKKMRIYLNNLRMNPSMYYEKYLSFNKTLIMTKKYLDDINQIKKESLIENSICYDLIEQYFVLPKQKKLQNSTNKNIRTQCLSKMIKELEFYLTDSIGDKVKVKAELTQRVHPSEITELFLLDKKFRPYIFDVNSKHVVIKIYNNFANQGNLVILAIILDRKNNKNDNENNYEEEDNYEEDNYEEGNYEEGNEEEDNSG